MAMQNEDPNLPQAAGRSRPARLADGRVATVTRSTQIYNNIWSQIALHNGGGLQHWMESAWRGIGEFFMQVY